MVSWSRSNIFVPQQGNNTPAIRSSIHDAEPSPRTEGPCELFLAWIRTYDFEQLSRASGTGFLPQLLKARNSAGCKACNLVILQTVS